MKNNFKIYNIKRHLLTCFLILANSSKVNSGQQSSDGILSLELIPKITIKGEFGKTVRVESSVSLNGPWTTWTNVLTGVESTVLVDLTAGSEMKYYRTVSGTSLGPDGFVWMPPVTFKTEYSEWGLEFNATVKLTKGFWISDHEVTQSEYQSIIGPNPSTVKGENFPVTNVSWAAAVAYCQQLTKWDQSAGKISLTQSYRLPTEAEWTYAANKVGQYFDFTDVVYDNKIRLVRQKKPNKFGIYDMLGNVSEWCNDWSGPALAGSLIDPIGQQPTGIQWMGLSAGRLILGGSSFSGVEYPLASHPRWSQNPLYGTPSLGFRPVLIER